MGVRAGYQYLEAPHGVVADTLNLPWLHTRRYIHDLEFPYKTKGLFACPGRLARISFHLPHISRSKDLFALEDSIVPILPRSPLIGYIQQLGNVVSPYVDFASIELNCRGLIRDLCWICLSLSSFQYVDQITRYIKKLYLLSILFVVYIFYKLLDQTNNV